MKNSISEEEEFEDPNINYRILLTEIKQRIINLQYDLNNIRDPEVLGFALNLYTELKNNYFNLTEKAMKLEHDLVVEQAISEISKKLGDVKNE